MQEVCQDMQLNLSFQEIATRSIIFPDTGYLLTYLTSHLRLDTQFHKPDLPSDSACSRVGTTAARMQRSPELFFFSELFPLFLRGWRTVHPRPPGQ